MTCAAVRQAARSNSNMRRACARQVQLPQRIARVLGVPAPDHRLHIVLEQERPAGIGTGGRHDQEVRHHAVEATRARSSPRENARAARSGSGGSPAAAARTIPPPTRRRSAASACPPTRAGTDRRGGVFAGPRGSFGVLRILERHVVNFVLARKTAEDAQRADLPALGSGVQEIRADPEQLHARGPRVRPGRKTRR